MKPYARHPIKVTTDKQLNELLPTLQKLFDSEEITPELEAMLSATITSCRDIKRAYNNAAAGSKIFIDMTQLNGEDRDVYQIDISSITINQMKLQLKHIQWQILEVATLNEVNRSDYDIAFSALFNLLNSVYVDIQPLFESVQLSKQKYLIEQTQRLRRECIDITLEIAKQYLANPVLCRIDTLTLIEDQCNVLLKAPWSAIPEEWRDFKPMFKDLFDCLGDLYAEQLDDATLLPDDYDEAFGKTIENYKRAVRWSETTGDTKLAYKVHLTIVSLLEKHHQRTRNTADVLKLVAYVDTESLVYKLKYLDPKRPYNYLELMDALITAQTILKNEALVQDYIKSCQKRLEKLDKEKDSEWLSHFRKRISVLHVAMVAVPESSLGKRLDITSQPARDKRVAGPASQHTKKRKTRFSDAPAASTVLSFFDPRTGSVVPASHGSHVTALESITVRDIAKPLDKLIRQIRTGVFWGIDDRLIGDILVAILHTFENYDGSKRWGSLEAWSKSASLNTLIKTIDGLALSPASSAIYHDLRTKVFVIDEYDVVTPYKMHTTPDKQSPIYKRRALQRGLETLFYELIGGAKHMEPALINAFAVDCRQTLARLCPHPFNERLKEDVTALQARDVFGPVARL